MSTSVCVYSFADASSVTKYVDDVGDFYYNGTWSATGTYVATPLNAVTYGAAKYMCIRDNIGDNPQRPPTRLRPQSWSIMSLLYKYECGGGTLTPTEAIAEAAYALAETGTNIAWAAYYLAQIGTNTGSAAYDLAANALNIANGAYSIAVAGTDAANDAYLLAQIGTNTGTAAYTLATSGSNLAWQSFELAQTGTNLLIIEQGTRAQADQNLQNQINALSGVTFADPTAEVTLSTVIGTGTTAMRSTSAPRLSQAIAPTWSGFHAFTKGLAVPTLAAVNLTAPNTYLITDSRGAITLSSDGTAWADREFTLAAGNREGHEMTLVWTGTGQGEMLNNAVYLGCRVRLQSDYWHPTNYSAMMLRFNGTDWLEMSRTPLVLAETGSSTASVAQAAYTLAQVGTNTGTAAYNLAQLAYITALSTGSSAGTLAADAYFLATVGTNIALDAYRLAQVGTNTGTAAYELAGSAYVLAGHKAASMILCSAYTPASIGADAAEVPVPYGYDGNSISWGANRFTVRVQTAGSSPSVAIEKSEGAGGFVATVMGTVTLAMNAYEGSHIPGSGTVNSGDKLRFFVLDTATAQNWTVAVELGV